MQDNGTRQLFCLVHGNPAPFMVTVSNNDYIYQLKEAIKDGADSIAVHPKDIVLWKLNEPEPVDPDETLAARIQSRGTDLSKFATRLSSGNKVLDIFPDDPADLFDLSLLVPFRLGAFLRWFFAGKGSSVAYLYIIVQLPRHRTPRPPPDLNTCLQLQKVLHSIQHHIAHSPTTLGFYHTICEEFNDQLYPDDPLGAISVDEVKGLFSSHWPTFVPLQGKWMDDPSQVHWGKVDKSCGAPNEVQLNPDLVRALEAAPKDSNLQIFLTMILITTVFHELCHHLTKLVFASRITPAGCGVDNFINGESGYLLEETLMGGVVGVLWNTRDVGEMDKFIGLVLEYRGHNRHLTVDHCKSFIASIETTKLEKVKFSHLFGVAPLPGIERHRLVPLSKLHIPAESQPPPGVIAPRGLGIADLDNFMILDNGVYRKPTIYDRF